MPQTPEDQFTPRNVSDEFPRWPSSRKQPQQMQWEFGDPHQTEFPDLMRTAREQAADTLEISHPLVSD